MSIYSSLRTAIRNVALVANDEYPDMLVNFSNQNGPEPVTSYVSINILDMQQIGKHATPALTNADIELDIRVAYEVTVQFSFFGTEAAGSSHAFINKLNNNPLSLEAMQKNKLGFMRKTTLRRNPQKRDTQWVDSFNFDVTFNYIVNTAQVVEYIDKVMLRDEYSGAEFTVPPDAV